MNNIIRPVRWWDMVSPREEEMPDFLRAYMGKGKQFRTPKHMWEDLWRLKRGEVNDLLGIRRARNISISNREFKGPYKQRGMLHPIGFWTPPAAGGTEPDLSNVSHIKASGANPQRVHLGYDSDGTIVWYEGGSLGSVTFAHLTTGTNDDTNDHTNEWWPDQPSTNEGLNWDLRYTNLTDGFNDHLSRYVGSPQVDTDRVEDTWYTIDDVSNGRSDGTNRGGLNVRITAKSTGTSLGTTDVEIRATGSGSAVASHNVNLSCTGTG